MKRPKAPRISVSEAGKRLKEISDRLRSQPVPKFPAGGITIHPSNIDTERVIQPSEIPQRNYHIIGACDYPDCSICNPQTLDKRKTLILRLIAKWFHMVRSGEKREEYREVTPYWIRRLITNENAPRESKDENRNYAENIFYDIENGHDPEQVIADYHCDFKDFDSVLFVNGFGSTRPRTCWVVKNIEIGTGRPEWGAVPGRRYFIIKLGAEIA